MFTVSLRSACSVGIIDPGTRVTMTSPLPFEHFQRRFNPAAPFHGIQYLERKPAESFRGHNRSFSLFPEPQVFPVHATADSLRSHSAVPSHSP